VTTARHAIAIDEKRRPFSEYRFDEAVVAQSQGRFQERWFAGVHGDIGGENTDDDQLPDIAFAWIAHEAIAATADGDEVGLLVDPTRYYELVGVDLGAQLPPTRALGVITPNKAVWRLALGWRMRPIRQGDEIDESVRYRMKHSDQIAGGYNPKNLPRRMGEH
jgi:hypothetical protein